jgi:glycosyltransferase involved in cell wall biosynthesis
MKASVCITRYCESDSILIRCLNSIFNQKSIFLEVVVIDQKPTKKIENFCLKNKNKLPIIYRKTKPLGLSVARNVGITESSNDFILYLDADATAEENWAYFLTKTLNRDRVAIAGSRILPLWGEREPIFLKSKVIWEQYSMLDFGELEKETTKIIGAGFGIDRKKTKNLVFNTRLGRFNGNLLGGEETEFCKKMRNKGFLIFYNGKSLVYHHVSKERTTLNWLIKRLFAAGRSRLNQGGYPKSTHKKNVYDLVFMPLIVVPYICGLIFQKLITINND